MAASFYLGACGRNCLEFLPFELLRTPIPGTSVNKGKKKDRSLMWGSGPYRSSGAEALLLGRWTLVRRRGRFDRHSWQMCLCGLIVASQVARRALTRRDELVDERKRRGGCHGQHQRRDQGCGQKYRHLPSQQHYSMSSFLKRAELVSPTALYNATTVASSGY
jgi:hypothetical protein